MKNRCLSLVLALVIVITTFSSCSSNKSPEATLKNIESVVYEKYGNDYEHVYFADTFSGSMLSRIEYDALDSESSRLGLNYKILIYYSHDLSTSFYRNSYNIGSPVYLLFYSEEFAGIYNVVEENFPKLYNDMNIDLEICENDLLATREACIRLYFPPDKNPDAFEDVFNACFEWCTSSTSYKHDFAGFRFSVDGNYEEIKSSTSIKDLFDLDPNNFCSLYYSSPDSAFPLLNEKSLDKYYTKEQIGQIGRKILNDLMYDFNTCLQSEFGVTLKNLGFESYEF